MSTDTACVREAPKHFALTGCRFAGADARHAIWPLPYTNEIKITSILQV